MNEAQRRQQPAQQVGDRDGSQERDRERVRKQDKQEPEIDESAAESEIEKGGEVRKRGRERADSHPTGQGLYCRGRREDEKGKGGMGRM